MFIMHARMHSRTHACTHAWRNTHTLARPHTPHMYRHTCRHACTHKIMYKLCRINVFYYTRIFYEFSAPSAIDESASPSPMSRSPSIGARSPIMPQGSSQEATPQQPQKPQFTKVGMIVFSSLPNIDTKMCLH